MTLTGPGGIGKTSLAVEVARAIAPRLHRRGVVRAARRGRRIRRDVAGAVARGVGLLDGPERTAATALVPYLADRSALLVLDNLEHLLDRQRMSIAAIMRGSPRSRIIVTSRAPLACGRRARSPGPAVDRRLGRPLRRACAGRPSRLGSRVGPRAVVRGDLPPAGRPAARDRAGGGPRRGPVADRHSGSPRRADAPARQRAARCAGPTTHPRDRRWPGATTSSRPTARRCSTSSRSSTAASTSSRSTRSRGRALDGGDRLDDLMELADHSLIVAVPDVPGRVRFRMLRTIESFGLGSAGRRRAGGGRPTSTCRGVPRPLPSHADRT